MCGILKSRVTYLRGVVGVTWKATFVCDVTFYRPKVSILQFAQHNAEADCSQASLTANGQLNTDMEEGKRPLNI